MLLQRQALSVIPRSRADQERKAKKGKRGKEEKNEIDEEKDMQTFGLLKQAMTQPV